MFGWLRNRRAEWTIVGWDTFGGHSYPIPGRFRSEAAAARAAKRHLKKLERMQPSETSGGQAGIQDHVYARGPDGRSVRVLPGE